MKIKFTSLLLGCGSFAGFSIGHGDLLFRSLGLLVALGSSEDGIFFHHLPLSLLVEVITSQSVEVGHSAERDSSRSFNHFSGLLVDLFLLARVEKFFLICEVILVGRHIADISCGISSTNNFVSH